MVCSIVTAGIVVSDRAHPCHRPAFAAHPPRRSRAARLAGCLFVAVSIVSSGCDVVVTRAPLPRADARDFENRLAGSWANDDGVIEIRFVEPGFAKLGSLEWEHDAFVLGLGELTLGEIDDRRFVSVRFQEDGAWPDEYYLAEVEIAEADDDVLLIWTALGERFRALIENGLLEGETVDGVVVTSKPEDLLAALADERAAGSFDYREPMVLRKLYDGPVRDESASGEEAPGEPTEPSTVGGPDSSADGG